MSRASSQELLDGLLMGDVPDVAWVDRLLTEKLKEDLWLDYKSGDFFAKKPIADQKREFRQMVTGFANAEGGTLVFGVTDNGHRPDTINGCDPKSVGGRDANDKDALRDWVPRVLGPVAGLIPPPRTHVVDHADGLVLIVAVGRADALVHENGVRGDLYFRIGDQTLRVDPYLETDLALGRRQRPRLHLEIEVRAVVDSFGLSLNLGLSGENMSLVDAGNVRGGLVGWCVTPPPSSSDRVRHFGTAEELPAGIRERIDATTRADRRLGLWRSDWKDLGVLDRHPLLHARPTLHGPGQSGVPASPPGSWCAGIFVVASNMRPSWYQLTVNYGWDAPGKPFANAQLAPAGDSPVRIAWEES